MDEGIVKTINYQIKKKGTKYDAESSLTLAKVWD